MKNAIERIYLNRRMAILQTANERLVLENQRMLTELEALRNRVAQLDYRLVQEGRVLGPRAEKAEVRDAGARTYAQLNAASPSGASPDEERSERVRQYARAARRPREQLKQELEKLDRLKREGRISEVEHEESKRNMLKSFFPS